jgi:DivIVA domain-containing protein
MEPQNPQDRIADLERQLAEQRLMAQPEPRQPGAVQPPGLTAEDVRNVAFTDAAGGERGYDHDEVDAFLDHIAPALQGQAGRTFTAEWVRSIAFTRAQNGKRGYDRAEVDEFVERVAFELDRRAGRQPMAYPAAGGLDNRTDSRRRGLQKGDIEGGIIDVIFAFFFRRGDDGYPPGFGPALGVILVVLGVATGSAACLWGGIALLVASAISLGYKLVRKLVPPVQPRDDQSPPGRHSAG